MRIQMQPEVKEFMDEHEKAIMTVRSKHKMIGANRLEALTHPVISFKVPEVETVESYDIFEIDGITVFFEKKLELVPEVTFVKEHHFLKDRIRIEGFQTPPPAEYMKL